MNQDTARDGFASTSQRYIKRDQFSFHETAQDAAISTIFVLSTFMFLTESHRPTT